MDYVVVAAIAFIAGIIIMSCVCECRMNEEGMKRFNDGYRKGLEDGKRMKGEVKNENHESAGSRR